jgi:hypothetical protein
MAVVGQSRRYNYRFIPVLMHGIIDPCGGLWGCFLGSSVKRPDAEALMNRSPAPRIPSDKRLGLYAFDNLISVAASFRSIEGKRSLSKQ